MAQERNMIMLPTLPANKAIVDAHTTPLAVPQIAMVDQSTSVRMRALQDNDAVESEKGESEKPCNADAGVLALRKTRLIVMMARAQGATIPIRVQFDSRHSVVVAYPALRVVLALLPMTVITRMTSHLQMPVLLDNDVVVNVNAANVKSVNVELAPCSVVRALHENHIKNLLRGTILGAWMQYAGIAVHFIGCTKR